MPLKVYGKKLRGHVSEEWLVFFGDPSYTLMPVFGLDKLWSYIMHTISCQECSQRIPWQRKLKVTKKKKSPGSPKKEAGPRSPKKEEAGVASTSQVKRGRGRPRKKKGCSKATSSSTGASSGSGALVGDARTLAALSMPPSVPTQRVRRTYTRRTWGPRSWGRGRQINPDGWVGRLSRVGQNRTEQDHVEQGQAQHGTGEFDPNNNPWVQALEPQLGVIDDAPIDDE